MTVSNTLDHQQSINQTNLTVLPSFDGQLNDERLLYVARPHKFFLLSGYFLIIIGAIVFTFIFKIPFAKYLGLENLEFIEIRLQIVTIAIFGLLAGYLTYWYNHAFTYLTTHRIIRFRSTFPLFLNKRSLLWHRVLKVKSVQRNPFIRIFKIGHVEILSESGYPTENISIKYVEFFEDLSNYIDKILYLHKNRPQELLSLREFIAKPKGLRY